MNMRKELVICGVICFAIGFFVSQQLRLEKRKDAERERREAVAEQERSEDRAFEKDFAEIENIVNLRDIEVYKLAIKRDNEILLSISNIIRRSSSKTEYRMRHEDALVNSVVANINDYKRVVSRLEERRGKRAGLLWPWMMFDIYNIECDCSCCREK